MYRKSLLGKPNPKILEYTSSIEGDREIVDEVIESLIAHVKNLKDLKMIPCDKGNLILKELKSLLENPDPLFSLKAEDVHEAIEIYLTGRIGEDEGYLALGKSRNDHVSSALRLKTKKILIEQIKALMEFRQILLERAESNLTTIMPAFTHMQPAQPSTFAHYLCYIEETLAECTKALLFFLKMVDKSPLGSGAVGSTSVPIDRKKLAKTLFSDMVINSISATSNRDFLSMVCSIDTGLSVFLSRIAGDVTVFTTPQFGYFILPQEHLATSSMMPQKKNPVTMEMARAWSGEAIGHLTAILTILKSVPTGYSLDLQSANKHAIAILKGTLETINVFSDLFKKIEVNEDKMRKDAQIFPILATDVAERITMKTGMPYRKVYWEVATLIKENDFYAKIKEKYGIEITLDEGIKKRVIGSPDPEMVKQYIKIAKRGLKKDASDLEKKRKIGMNEALQ
jgi:argininosuccinate lyase